jgi:excisionase family DNA binding protein
VKFAFAFQDFFIYCKFVLVAYVLFCGQEVILMRLLTAKQVAPILQVTEARVYEMSRENLLPTVRMGRQVRYDEEALINWIRAGGCAQVGSDNSANSTQAST